MPIPPRALFQARVSPGRHAVEEVPPCANSPDSCLDPTLQRRRFASAAATPRRPVRHNPVRMARPQPRGATYLLYGGAPASLTAVHLATNPILGFHIDELYYMASGRHPAFRYVDFPPIVPLLARLETALLGVTPWTLRVLPGL